MVHTKHTNRLNCLQNIAHGGLWYMPLLLGVQKGSTHSQISRCYGLLLKMVSCLHGTSTILPDTFSQAEFGDDVRYKALLLLCCWVSSCHCAWIRDKRWELGLYLLSTSRFLFFWVLGLGLFDLFCLCFLFLVFLWLNPWIQRATYVHPPAPSKKTTNKQTKPWWCLMFSWKTGAGHAGRGRLVPLLLHQELCELSGYLQNCTGLLTGVPGNSRFPVMPSMHITTHIPFADAVFRSNTAIHS